MCVQRFVDDAHELTTLLKQRFGQDRIYVFGHSWGTQLGLLLVRDHPDDYRAYIGVSQLVHRDRSQEIAYAILSARITGTDGLAGTGIHGAGPPCVATWGHPW